MCLCQAGAVISFLKGGKDSDNVRGGGPGAEPPEKFCFPPPKFLGGGKGFQTVFWERLIPQEPNS